MERRRSERKIIDMETVLISDNKSYSGVIGNISEYGVYVRTNLTNTAIDFLPKTTVTLKIHTLSEETLHLPCEIIWLYTKQIPTRRLETDDVLENDIGMEIKNPPPAYKKFFENL